MYQRYSKCMEWLVSSRNFNSRNLLAWRKRFKAYPVVTHLALVASELGAELRG